MFGHSDADGHLAAQQTDENLESSGIEIGQVVVSPETSGYRFWGRSFTDWDLSPFGLVVVVDIAFRFRDPVESLTSVLAVVDDHPETEFVIVDHHPLPGPDLARGNLLLIEARSAYDCCVGTPSDELMVVAAICDGDADAVRPLVSDTQKKRADGVRRAAADVRGVAGSRLLTLLDRRRWDFFEDLADEPSEYHKRVRGRRTARSLTSPLLEKAMAGKV